MRSGAMAVLSWTCLAILVIATCYRLSKSDSNKRLRERATKIRIAAEQGDPKAEVALGGMFYYGEGLPRNYVEAVYWFRKAADQGNSRAEYDLAHTYELGQGLSKDYAEAVRWYRKAADQGEPWAQFSLGEMYYDGRGLPQDRTEASVWYRKAADQGLPNAQYDLGYMYSHGQGVPESRSEADIWYHKAADQGYEPAQQALGLRSNNLNIRGAFGLIGLSISCIWTLRAKPVRGRQRQVLIVSGLDGLLYVGLKLFTAFHAFKSALALNVFYLIENMAIGVVIASCVYFVTPNGIKLVVSISGIALLGIICLASERGIWHSISSLPGLFSLGGLFIGILIPTTFFLWLIHRDGKRAYEGQSN